MIKFANGRYKVSDNWFVCNSKRGWILIGQDELIRFIWNEAEFFENISISTFTSMKQLIANYKREPYYKHLFENIGGKHHEI